MLAPTLTKAALLTALKQRRVYATEDRNLRLVYRVNNQLMGSRIVGAAVPAPGTALTLTLAITDDDEPAASYTVDVFSDDVGGEAIAGVVRSQSVTGNGTHTISGVTYSGARNTCSSGSGKATGIAPGRRPSGSSRQAHSLHRRTMKGRSPCHSPLICRQRPRASPTRARSRLRWRDSSSSASVGTRCSINSRRT